MISPFAQQVCAALKEASQIAVQRAIEHGTKLVVWDGEKVVEMDPTEIEKSI